MANTDSLPEEEFELQSKRRDFIFFQKGAVEKGRKEEKMMIAKRSLEQGLEVQVVVAITGLSVNEVEQLQGSKQKNETN
ncbi:MAG: hypothetical protein WGN25_10635 [Candidatus Electrothrix sp. GW3-4]|uniref:hypothetical protein n=1 Tax=Candidatus Electrothrix sp. GW3-4 TaxID=3126740 RepID=UPI0030CDEF76